MQNHSYKNRLAQALCLLFVASLLTGCAVTLPEQTQAPAAETQENEPPEASDKERFSAFLEEYVREELQKDYTTMHWAYTDPEAAGIDRSLVEVTLGPVIMTPEEMQEEVNALREALAEFSYDELDPEQQDIYDALVFEADIEEKQSREEYQWLDNIWSSSGGVHQVLVSHFAEYSLYSEEDIQDLLLLLADVPRFVEEALEYSRQQAAHGTLCFDYEGVLETCLGVLDARDDSAIIRGLEKDIDLLELPEETAADYKKQVRQAVDAYFYPSYDPMIEELQKLHGDVLPLTGMADRPDGRDYYELCLQENLGTDESADEIRARLQLGMDDALTEIQTLMQKDISYAYADPFSVETGYDSLEEILEDLAAAYSEDFPEVEPMQYELEGISDERAADFSAYFVIPTIDSTRPYEIRYNEKSIGTAANTIDMFSTISHEGIPGHMYQTQYNHEHLHYAIQYLESKTGFAEGWATYAATQGLRTLDVKEDMLRFYVAYSTYLNTMGALMELEIHYDGITFEQFKEAYGIFFMEDGLRSTYEHLADNVIYYAPYYYGYHRIADLRREAEEELGEAFDARDFHEALLRRGSTIFPVVERNVAAYIEENRS